MKFFIQLVTHTSPLMSLLSSPKMYWGLWGFFIWAKLDDWSSTAGYKKGVQYFFYFWLGHHPSWNKINLFQTSLGSFPGKYKKVFIGRTGFLF